MQDHRSVWFSAILLLAMVALVAVMVVDLFPLVGQVVKDHSDEGKVVQYIEAYGAKGVPILIGIQVLQVFLSVIPATLIQTLAGLCYGIWRGTLLCVVGCVLGNGLLFLLLRQGGKVLAPVQAQKPRKPKKAKHSGLSLRKIAQSKHPERAVFLLYLIPGIPDGILPLLFVKSSITLPRFVLAVTAASLPSALISTWLGERLSKGDYKTAIVLVIILIVVAVILFLNRNRLLGLLDKEIAPTVGGDRQ